MLKKLRVYNTLKRDKEFFEPLSAPLVGMYVCGPTVYGDAHLGHARSAITFDVIFRYLTYLGYKVRYVRNITDVGHLERDSDDGDDKIAKKARLEQLEPMEVVQQYTASYHRDMGMLNVATPSIEPRASGHIIEQIEMIQQILDKGLAYIAEGSVYFDVEKYNESQAYGVLSGRVLEDLMSGTRDLDGQSDKKSSLDFALWKKAEPEHIMRWPSPWSDGFPGWHLECSAMSTKYLGDHFDIHGGGMDLLFPHHECEIAQCVASKEQSPAKYWLHNNMITINGQKMGKSLGNFITLQELFTGDHKLLESAYSPMTIRFFILQAHYRSTLDFSNEALQAAQKGYIKIANGLKILKNLEFKNEGGAVNEKAANQIEKLCDNVLSALNDDFNTALAIGHLFNILKKINSIYTGNLSFDEIGEETFNRMKTLFIDVSQKVLGILEEGSPKVDALVNSIIKLYKGAKERKDYDLVDQIRADLKAKGIVVKDLKMGVDWAYEE